MNIWIVTQTFLSSVTTVIDFLQKEANFPDLDQSEVIPCDSWTAEILLPKVSSSSFIRQVVNVAATMWQT